jgi:hypothetical protein
MNLYKLDKRDRTILGTASAVLIVSLLFTYFYDDLYGALIQSRVKNLQKVAFSKKSKNDVRRKYSSEFSWGPLKTSKDIYEGDTLFTGSDSELIVRTEKGEELLISENSLVVIKSERDALSLDIGFGAIETRLDKGSRLILTTAAGTSTLTSEGASFKVDAGSGDQLYVQVSEGNLKVNSAGQTGQFGKGQLIEINNGLSEGQKYNIKQLSPLAGQFFEKRTNIGIEFRWTSASKVTRPRLKISTDQEFKNVIVNTPAQGSSHIAYDLPHDIKLYWQVLAEGGQSKINHFVIVGRSPPIPIKPEQGKEILLPIKLVQAHKGAEPELSWEAGSPSRKYLVQIASDKKFSSLIAELKSGSNTLKAPALPPGKYFWRVRSLELAESPWSMPAQFSVTPQYDERLASPILISKDFYLIDSKFPELGVSLEQIKKFKPQVANWPELKWTSVAGAKAFEVQLSKTPTFRQIDQTFITRDKNFVLKNVKPGRYYWRTRAMRPGYIESEYTDAQTFTVQITPPRSLIKETIIEFTDNPDLILSAAPPQKLIWTPTVYTKFYELQTSDKSDFNDPKVFVTDIPEREIYLPGTNKIYWRVRALDVNKNPISSFSQSYALSFERVQRAPASFTEIKPINPSSNYSIIYIGKGTAEYVFEWSKVFGASSYEIQISDTPNFERLNYVSKSKTNHHLVSGEIPTGKAFWRARALSKDFIGAWMPPVSFYVSNNPTPFDYETSIQIFAARRAAKDRQLNLIAQFQKDIAQIRSPASITTMQLDTPQNLKAPKIVILKENQEARNLLKRPDSKSLPDLVRIVQNPPILSWNKVPAAERYYVEISFNPEFTQKIISAPTLDPYYKWDTARPGLFYWRVLAVNDRYLPSNYSSVEMLDIRTHQVELDIYKVRDAAKEIVLSWKPVLFAHKYELILSSNKNFTDAEVYYTTSTAIKLKNKWKNHLYYKARPLNQVNVGIAEWTRASIYTETLNILPAIRNSRLPASQMDIKAGR